MKIGFVGLGIMGSRMAANLGQAGHDLIVHNRTKAKADSLIAAGATWADTPRQAATEAELFITMLATPEAVQAVALGPDGFLNHLPANSLWLDCSTVNPSFSRQMAQEATSRQVRFVDAPVAGSKEAAETGQLMFLVGGEETDVAFCQPLFDIMGQRTILVGGQGKGTSMKMVVNLLLGEAMLAFAEAMSLGLSLGLSKEMLLQSLLTNPIVVAPFVVGKRPKIEQGAYEADFPLKLMRKDLHLAATTGYEQGVSLPAVNVIKEIYALAVREGLGEQDFSAIYKFMVEE